jgi:ATP-dependent DNA helicase RecQ
MEKHLKLVYGHNQFRSYQKEIIEDILNKDNVSVIMPTGMGKSLLYQFPATYTNKITVIVSPLISLINDQCQALQSKNIKCLNLSEKNFCTNLKRCSCTICKVCRDEEELTFIYCTPEWFSVHGIKLLKIKEKIGLIACDEAHCISNWSHDFRPSYKKICNQLSNFHNIPLLTVTATATPDVLEDIYEILEIETINEYSTGSKRPNLAINIFDKASWNIDVVNKDEPTIIYAQSRKETESLAIQFQSNGIDCLYYHAGMSDKDRTHVHNEFLEGKINLVIATIAFGMGINKSDIRHVINYGIPTDLETFYQEIGRAGRDGMPCKSSLYYDDKDFNKAVFLIKKGNESQLENKYRYLDIFKNFLQDNTICRQVMIDEYLKTGSLPTENIEEDKCAICDNCNCVQIGILFDITTDANKVIDILSLEPYALGMTKTLQLCKSIGLKDYLKIIINELCKKKFIKKDNTKFGILYQVTTKNHVQNIQVFIPELLYNSIMKSTHVYDRVRKLMADKYNISEKTFLNDKVLHNIKQIKPTTLMELIMVDGVSEEFAVNYGSELLSLVKPGCIQSKPKKNTTEKCKPKISTTIQETINLYKNGSKVKEIATIRNIKSMTVENHISEYYGTYPSEIKDTPIIITVDNIKAVNKAKNNLPENSKLTPIMDQLEDISWLQLKIILKALSSHSEQELIEII